MSAKILSSLSDDNRTNLRKQIGCINGLFQIFDRRHLLSTRNQTRLDLLEQSEKPQPLAAKIKISQSPDLRDVVKDSMNREARSIKEVKHIDSPRPLRHYSDENQQMMMHARFSYDGRESTKVASSSNTRLKEQVPRLSLDSRASSSKFFSSETARSDLVDRFQVGYVRCREEPGNHRRSSSVVVAKLMGLESFPEPDSATDEHRRRNSISNTKEILASSRSSSKKPDARHQQNDLPSPRFHRADCSQGSQHGIKASPTSSSSPRVSSSSSSSCSVYGEIEKRVAELEFKKSGKDLRALKQILEAMQRTRERTENQQEQSAAVSSSTPRRSNSDDNRAKFISPTNVASIDVMCVQRLQNLTTKQNHKEDMTSRRNVRAFEPQEIYGHVPSINKKGVVTRREMEHDRLLKASRGSKVKSCTKLQQKQFHGEESSKITKQSNKKPVERRSKEDKKNRLKSRTRLSDEANRQVMCSSYQGVEQQKYVKTRTEQMSPVQLEDTSIEQPSPVSVLDGAVFSSEDPPSPIRKITLVSQEDEDANFDDFEKPISETSINSVRNVILPGRDQGAASSNHNASSVFVGPSNSNFSRHITSPEMFHVLEMEAAKDVKSNHTNHRKIISDVVSEILYRKLVSGGLYAAASRRRTSPQDLMKEVYLELNSISTIQICDFNDEDDDGILKLIASDMKYDSEDWTTHKNEAPALVLDIERLIFKDLITEVLTNTAF